MKGFRITVKNKLLFLFLGFVLGVLSYYSISLILFPDSVSSVFSPGAEEEVIDLINSAESSIYIEMYVFSSDDIIYSLINAKKRGVDVMIILEKRVLDDKNLITYNRLEDTGIEIVWASENFKLTHSKFMIIDKKLVFVGSHNFSNSALNFNREASVIIKNPKIVNDFLEVFEEDWLIGK